MPLLRHRRRRLKRRPQEARQLARNGDRDFGGGLVLLRQASEASTQALLRLVRDRDDPARLIFPSSRQAHAYAGAMLIVPGRFHEQPTDQRVPGPGDAPAAQAHQSQVLPLTNGG